MASSFQQQARQRKTLYIGLIVVLFTLSILWRKNVTDALAGDLAIREESRGEVELVGAAVRIGLTGSRGLVTCILWDSAMEKQKKNQWNELEVLVRSLTRLQPHFITPWLFQSWNLAYNVSVESDRVRDKYFYVTRGVELLAEGERQNHNHPDLRWSIGFYLQHKICKSDETNFMRSLFQLSAIPPNERDPARFWKQTQGDPQFNYDEFEKFCVKHPQLVRRLKHGVHRETAREKKRQFLCEGPEDVVQFLEDNYSVPSLYAVPTLPADGTAQSRGWSAATQDTLLDPDVRFPCLPPQHSDAFDPAALSSQSELRDETDGYAVAHAWFSYAQEPLPAPGDLPGSSKDVVNPALQRRPKNMTTLIFRHYPAMMQRFVAERLQEEGWFDGQGWDVSEFFRDSKEPGQSGKQVVVGAGVNWSLDAWKRASAAWEKHGRDNHMLFPTPASEQTETDRALRFAKEYHIPPFSPPPDLGRSRLSGEAEKDYDAARFMYEYDFYRRLTNFNHHYVRAAVEAKPITVECRKAFYHAEEANLDGFPVASLELYKKPIQLEAADGRSLDPLSAWRDLVLMQNKEFRRDSFIQEGSAEIEIRYLMLWNRHDAKSKELRSQLSRASKVLPLLPPFDATQVTPPIINGPFDVDDGEGVALVPLEQKRTTLERLGLFKREVPTTPEAMREMKRVREEDMRSRPAVGSQR